MNQSSHQSVRKTQSTRWLLWAPMAVAAVCCAAVIDWSALTQPASATVVQTAAVAPESPPAKGEIATARPVAGRGLAPRLLRATLPDLPVALSEEAKRMVNGMLDVYRCNHSGSKRSLPLTAGDTKPLAQSLATMPDACYVNSTLGRIANPETAAVEMKELFEDLLKRPDALKLRMLFVISSIETHPMAAEALTQLRGMIGTDWEQDWGRWEQAVNQLAAHEDRGVRIASCRSR